VKKMVTDEITLQGSKPVGGIKEKILAAKRANIKVTKIKSDEIK
jgi:ATP-dependent Lon protease